MKFNEKLILLRKKARLSQEELAAILGVTRQSISKWELGECEPNMSKIQIISRQFSVSIDYLLNNDIGIDSDGCINFKVDKMDEAAQNEDKSKLTEAKLIINYWFIFILIGCIGVVICAIIPYIFEHLYCYTGHSGFLGYLEDWCAGVIVWKIGLLISIALLVIGIIKTFCKQKNKYTKESNKRKRNKNLI